MCVFVSSCLFLNPPKLVWYMLPNSKSDNSHLTNITSRHDFLWFFRCIVPLVNWLGYGCWLSL